MTEILDTIREVSGPLTVTRATTEVVDRGIVVPGSVPVAGIEGHMQPLSPRELRMVPEGMNTLEWWHVWALQPLVVDDQVTDGSAPVIRLLKIETWKEAPFWHAQGTRVDDDLVRQYLFQGVGNVTLPKLIPAATGTA